MTDKPDTFVGVRPDVGDVEDVVYVEHASGPLLARIHRPRDQGARDRASAVSDTSLPILIDLHGGAWCTGDRTNDRVIAEAMAARGIVTVALDFRMPPLAGYPASLQDIHLAIRWVKARASSLGGHPERIGLVGISSGGHQAMLLALAHRDPRYASLPSAGGANAGAEDASVAAVVMCWPVIDPLGRYRYAKAVVAKGGAHPEALARVLPHHDAYWGSEAAMLDGQPLRVLEALPTEPAPAGPSLPAVLVLQGEADLVHPRAQLEAFAAAYRARGGRIEVAFYPGEVEGFMQRNTRDPENAANALDRMAAFVHASLR